MLTGLTSPPLGLDTGLLVVATTAVVVGITLELVETTAVVTIMVEDVPTVSEGIMVVAIVIVKSVLTDTSGDVIVMVGISDTILALIPSVFTDTTGDAIVMVGINIILALIPSVDVNEFTDTSELDKEEGVVVCAVVSN